jgi:LPXTG-site transpeptidase (sortase) family protein
LKSSRRLPRALTLDFTLAFALVLAVALTRSNESVTVSGVHVSALPTFATTTSSASPGARVPIGELTIASAGIYSLPITRGIDQATLNTGMAGSYPWSGPGKSGVFALAAHRVGAGGPFRHLDQVHVGDRIAISVGKQEYLYRVTSNVIVDPSDTSVLNGPKDESRIVLITCTPLDTFAQRIVVTGILIPTTSVK